MQVKLEKISALVSINGITAIDGWEKIIPDIHNDWVNQRDDSFNEFVEIGNKKNKSAKALFNNYSLGVGTNRDAWAFQSNKQKVAENIKKTINFYNLNLNESNEPQVDLGQIGWSSSLVSRFKRKLKLEFNLSNITLLSLNLSNLKLL